MQKKDNYKGIGNLQRCKKILDENHLQWICKEQKLNSDGDVLCLMTLVD